MRTGRPPKYKPEFEDMLIEMGKQGKTITQMAVGLGIAKSTLYEWDKTNKNFSDALTRAKEISQAYWEQIGHDALFAEKFQASVYNKQMSNRFPEDWRDNSGVDLTSKGEKIENIKRVVVDPKDDKS